MKKYKLLETLSGISFSSMIVLSILLLIIQLLAIGNPCLLLLILTGFFLSLIVSISTLFWLRREDKRREKLRDLVDMLSE